MPARAIAAIAAAWQILLALVGPVFDLIDQRRLMRRGAFLWVLAITGKVTAWTLAFASDPAVDAASKAAIIAAVWGPLAILQGAIFKFYDDGRAGG